MAARHTLGYVRVSTEKQADEGLSLEAQTVKIRQMADLRDLALTEGDVISDAGESAKSLNRPGLTWLLAQVDAGAVGTVIIAKLDRLTRSTRDLWPLIEHFERRHVTLISVAETLDTSTAMGRAMLNIIATLSQWEREAIGERTRDVLRHKKAKGERVGTLPFGFRLVAGSRSQLEPDVVEQDKLALIRNLKAAGGSTRKISDALNEAGLTTRRGTPWRGQYVARILQRA
ncbi:MAG: recombinase family protein [Acidobacteriota bacterium]